MILVYPNSYNLPVIEDSEGFDMMREAQGDEFEDLNKSMQMPLDYQGAMLEEIDNEYVNDSTGH